MKYLITLAIALSTPTAFAMMPNQLAQTMAHPAVIAALDGQYMTNVEDAPTPRCMGCFGLLITAEDGDRVRTVYEAQGSDFGGFQVVIKKVD
ncbi:MAG: hypothetical protein EOP11_13965 [Proteobacteria bacterium]|nr:MAG: hypothetical protein EOP11_13965 [Pseudomonadota bacterium]